MKYITAIALMCMMAGAVAAKETITPDKQVIYKTIGETELRLHVFEPEGHKSTDKRPAIVFFFGGGWTGGAPKQFYQHASRFAAHGFVAMSAEYRVMGTHKTTPFECVKDGKSAVRWIRQHADELGIDPNRIVSAGGSAGGHVAACCGVIPGHEEQGEDPSVSELPNAMILYNPVIDTTEKGYGVGKVGQDRKTEISPCHHVRQGIPPTLIFHGTADKTVPFENVQRFTNQMKEAGNTCVLIPFEGKGHGFFNGSFFRPKSGDDDFNTTMDKSLEFLKELGITTKAKPARKSGEKERINSNSAIESNRGQAKRPNVVLIFIDDMGYGDIEPFGSTKNKTPNLNRMAAEGVKLTDFYVSSTACTPSRSALMTGCYADRIGMDGRVNFPGSARGLNPSEITVAEMLKAQGYATGCFGKWHLGDMPQFMPLQQGFDEYEGIPYSNDMWPHLRDFPPLPYMKQEKAVAYISDAPSQALLCEAITVAAVDFIERHRDQAFFAYVPHSFVHLPRLVSKQQGDLAKGDATRAQVEAVDESVGRILDTLRELGIAENTLVFFTSDNGPASGLTAAPLRGAKGGPKYEGHMRMPTLAWWPGKIPAGTVCSEIGATIDIFPTLAELCGGEVPTDRIIDGKDISALMITPDAESPHSELYYEYDGIRQGNWKLVKVKNAFHLFDLDTDIGEQKNLATKYPEKVTELRELLDAHKAKVASARRPHGTADNPRSILNEPGDLPTLAQYMNQPALETVGSIHKSPQKKK